MKIFKKFILVIVMAMAIFLFAGCGGAPSGSAGASGDAAQTEANAGDANNEAAAAAQDAADRHSDADIGMEAVKGIVLAKVSGATEADIYEIETEYDNGRLEYEGSLFFGGYEYEFEIDAATGNILAWEIDD